MARRILSGMLIYKFGISLVILTLPALDSWFERFVIGVLPMAMFAYSLLTLYRPDVQTWLSTATRAKKQVDIALIDVESLVFKDFTVLRDRLSGRPQQIVYATTAAICVAIFNHIAITLHNGGLSHMMELPQAYPGALFIGSTLITTSFAGLYAGVIYWGYRGLTMTMMFYYTFVLASLFAATPSEILFCGLAISAQLTTVFCLFHSKSRAWLTDCTRARHALSTGITPCA